jgi:AcrR family transcriptional regulator
MTSFEVLGRSYALPFADIGNKTKEHILIEATVLFSLKGYSAVSMKDIAKKVGITAAALYNHFASKEELWEDALEHIVQLYYLYHDSLENALGEAKTIEEIFDTLFEEPRQMRNMFTCYGFSLIMKEQFKDKKAGELYRDVLFEYGRSFAKKWMDYSIERGLVKQFDTNTVATIFINCVLVSISMKVQESLNPDTRFDIASTFDGLKRFVLDALETA